VVGQNGQISAGADQCAEMGTQLETGRVRIQHRGMEVTIVPEVTRRDPNAIVDRVLKVSVKWKVWKISVWNYFLCNSILAFQINQHLGWWIGYLFISLNPSHTRGYDYLRPPATYKTDDHQRLSASKTFRPLDFSTPYDIKMTSRPLDT
jgi:hypothetical protein